MRPTRRTLTALLLILASPPAAWAQFDPTKIPVELQVWWGNSEVANGLPFGHIHAAIELPIGQTVSGALQRQVRLVLHDNPSQVYNLRIRDDKGNIYVNQALNFTCPFDGTTGTNCALSVPVTIDTAQRRLDGSIRAPDGWRGLKLEVRADSADPKILIYETSSDIPLFFQNGAPRSDYKDESGKVQTGLRGHGLYGEIYPAIAVIENPPRAPVSGIYTFRVRTENPKGNLARRIQVALDKSHVIPAVGSWPEEPASTGSLLLDQAVFSGTNATGSPFVDDRSLRNICTTSGATGCVPTIPIDTTQLIDGWHSLSVRSDGQRDEASSCAYCAGLPEQLNSGVAKIWFYVDNGGIVQPPPLVQVATPVLSPTSTTFQTSQQVTLSVATPGAEIRYTLDGSAPAATSLLYTGPFLLNTTTTVRVKAFAAGMTPSDDAVAVYTLVVCTCTPIP